eukprot:1302463-Pyramimonas_sp.AAC.1
MGAGPRGSTLGQRRVNGGSTAGQRVAQLLCAITLVASSNLFQLRGGARMQEPPTDVSARAPVAREAGGDSKQRGRGQ